MLVYVQKRKKVNFIKEKYIVYQRTSKNSQIKIVKIINNNFLDFLDKVDCNQAYFSLQRKQIKWMNSFQKQKYRYLLVLFQFLQILLHIFFFNKKIKDCMIDLNSTLHFIFNSNKQRTNLPTTEINQKYHQVNYLKNQQSTIPLIFLFENVLILFIMEEPQKSEKNTQFKDSNGFEDMNEDIDFKLSNGADSDMINKIRPFDESLILDKLPEQFLSSLVKSNLSDVYFRSEKEYEKGAKSRPLSDISNISELPNHSHVLLSKNSAPVTNHATKYKAGHIQISADVIQSDLNHTNVRTSYDDLIHPRQYTRIFKVRNNASIEVIIDRFTRYIKDNAFETINENGLNVWVRKVFSNNIFKLIFHLCCGVHSNIADYELAIRNSTVELKLTGDSNNESLRILREMEIVLWKSHQLELSQDDSLRFFIDSQESDKLSNQLKFIMEAEEHENGLELCMFSCLEQAEQFTQRFKLKCWNKELSHQGKLLLEKQIFLSSQLFLHFKRYFQKPQIKLISKKRQLLKTVTVSQCFDYLEVDPPYRLQYSVISSRIIPYWQAVRILERINYYITPRQKLDCLNSYYETIQECCRTYHGGKVLLETMDNILPILIYTLLFARVDYIYANIKMVEIFLRQVSVCEPGLKMVANVFASVEYISNCWDLKDMK